MSGFTLQSKGNVKYYTIDSFEKTGLVKHCFSTKHGGVSSGIFESMNLKPDSDDLPENIIENFKIISNAISIDYEKLVFSNQVHDDKIYIVTPDDVGKGIYRSSDILGVDALICAEKEIPLVTFYADCVPVYLLDVKNHVIGLVHSGWKGTVKKIVQKTINTMIETYGTQMEDLLVAIGPSIGVCHFEVGESVAKEFCDVFGTESIEQMEGKAHVDLQKCIAMQLDDLKIPDKNITHADICTYCNHDLLFSHRATNGKRGGLVAIMQLR